MAVRGSHDDRMPAPQFLMQQTYRIVLGVVGAEGIRTDEFRQGVAFVRFGPLNWAHFVQNHGNSGMGNLPGSLAACQSAANDVDGSDHGA